MVTLTEVEDEHFQGNQAGPQVDDDDYSDTGTHPLLCAFGPSRYWSRAAPIAS